MKLPGIRGMIRRRVMVNFRAEPEVVQRLLPAPLEPKLVGGVAVVGICLIRMEKVRPRFVPVPCGLESENAAHRISVVWTEEGEGREGVYIPRRDTNSVLSHLAGGGLFSGECHRARFDVRDEGSVIDFAMKSEDGEVEICLHGHTAAALPATSIFTSLAEASAFFETGSPGCSSTSRGPRLDSIRLQTVFRQVEPLAVDSVYSSYFADESRFPDGSVQFDSALLMRNVPDVWESVTDFRAAATPALASCAPTACQSASQR